MMIKIGHKLKHDFLGQIFKHCVFVANYGSGFRASMKNLGEEKDLEN